MTSAAEWFEQGMAAISLSHHADYRSEYVGDLESAVEAFDQVLALEPEHAEAQRQRGLALALLGRHEAALDSFVAAAAAAKADPDLRLAAAQSLLKLGRDEAALEALDEVLRARPADEEALFQRAEVLTRLQRHEPAVAAWDAVLGLRDNKSMTVHGRPVRVLTGDFRRLQARLARATALARLGRPEAAAVFREVFDDHAVELSSSFVARGFHEALKTLEVARAAYRAHLEGLGAEPSTWRRAADVWLAIHASDEALRAAERLVALRPDAQGWYVKAEAHAQAGQLDAAIAAYERSLELRPEFLGAQARLKVIRAQRDGAPR